MSARGEHFRVSSNGDNVRLVCSAGQDEILGRVRGVEDASVNLATEKANVGYDPVDEPGFYELRFWAFAYNASWSRWRQELSFRPLRCC